jgi:hypothetical protein
MESRPVTAVTMTYTVTCRDSGPAAHRRISRKCGTAPAAKAMVPAATAGVRPERTTSTTWLTAVAKPEARV